ncbi:galactokinase [Leptospira broomii serovar Hurstbridge str. 5399]|uniref:Galactokinase n=1 Tax=Leptospira broomii serovar Hurstbridge str. 5399 TaxID=1049789 RepID=T0F9P5_9LEPT|nr:galactokinase [Leptospira broomii]EQA44282.1 galactokinase [Leptospira broomii serovar Hurstbridge str. 5399]
MPNYSFEALTSVLNSFTPISIESEFRFFSAPARINIIGEHVDYAGGIVLPAAIDFRVYAAVRKNGTDEYRLHSLDFKASKVAKEIKYDEDRTWANYVLGVVSEAKKRGLSVPGFDLSFGGNIPQGAGLSSSAAVEVVTCYALSELFGWGLSLKEIALLSQAAENKFVGVNCGIMDQLIISVAKKESCISLNTKTLDYEFHPLELRNCEFYLIDSKKKHSLKESGYNERRTEVESATEKIRQLHPELSNLYDAEEKWVESAGLSISEKKRALHVIGEKERTNNVIRNLISGDIRKIGSELFACNDSLSRLFQVTSPETDFIVNWLKSQKVIGARMIGGGFGGCVLVLDFSGRSDSLFSQLNPTYHLKFGHPAEIYHFQISDGVREDR